MNDDNFFREVTNGVFTSGSEPSSPQPGGNGGGPIDQSILDARRLLEVARLENQRIDLVNKLTQITHDYPGPNASLTMNSPKLVNLVFTNDNRTYMFNHLQKFHPDTLDTNGFRVVKEFGFSCTSRISRGRLALFSDVNTVANS
jgi:hypothetical protein